MLEVNDDDDEDLILDRTKMIPEENNVANTLGLNQFNIGSYDYSREFSKKIQ